MIRVFLVDDHEIVRRGLAGLGEFSARHGGGRRGIDRAAVSGTDRGDPSGRGAARRATAGRQRDRCVQGCALTCAIRRLSHPDRLRRRHGGCCLRDGRRRRVCAEGHPGFAAHRRNPRCGRRTHPARSRRCEAGKGKHPHPRRRGPTTGFAGPAGTADPEAHRRRTHEPSDRRAPRHRREDGEELCLLAAQQTRAGKTYASRDLSARASESGCDHRRGSSSARQTHAPASVFFISRSSRCHHAIRARDPHALRGNDADGAVGPPQNLLRHRAEQTSRQHAPAMGSDQQQ